MKRPTAAVFDLDNTLSDARWREPLIDSDGWDAFHARAAEDDPINLDLLQIVFGQVDQIIFITGRPQRYDRLTRDWMSRHFARISPRLHTAPLRMRPNDDHRPGGIVKADRLWAMMEKYHIEMFVDDDQHALIAYAAVCPDAEFYLVRGHKNIHRVAPTAQSAPALPIQEEAAREASGGTAAAAPARGVEPKKPRKKPHAILHDIAATVEARGNEYGPAYRRGPDLMRALFPESAPDPRDPRVHVLGMICAKLARFANSKLQHRDSIHDVAGYAAILESLLDD